MPLRVPCGIDPHQPSHGPARLAFLADENARAGAGEIMAAIPQERSQRVRAVTMDRPWAWLAAGWHDLIATPQIGLTYGAIFAAFGLAITAGAWAAGVIYLTLPLAAGFMLIGPILAVGLYDVSRRLSLGETPSLAQAASAWQANRTQIALMGMVLLIIFLFWIRIASLLFALFFSKSALSLDSLVRETLFTLNGVAFLFVGSAIGGVLAVVVFALSAVSVPMLLDRPVNVFAAIATSWEVTFRNPKTMVLWAALIALFAGVGLVTFYVGLIVALPLLAHATWHAYRDTVANDSFDSER